ncbi:NACHT and WD40 domain protein [Colletotrichum truncatum]|uniref:NACHT and WD40 domain protein n=1 Tax=Colletotrichum truncatum TaxID=5467 RepID=A0ACC3YJW6_COLTU|nr:NACHT and WD40 domain protein [Colletotrichum truncatum]KAF6797439.1 NACHT and WD40 domain protein [Colletotrichum truncatum]
MLRKKEVYTTVTPIPGFIPRQLAIDILHSHSEVITLNPLVLDHKPIKAPRDAASDEYYSTWYEITERVQFIPGIGKMGSGKISFNGCFHDMPWGLQTHTYAPMNIDIRIKYRIDGNQPGVEPPQQPEIGMSGLGVPADGLYLREDIEIRCNVTMTSFVKTQLKAASKEMVSRIIKKAELLDAGVLQAMFEDGKLKTINPADRTNTALRSPTFPHNPSGSPRPESYSPGNPRYQVPRPSSVQSQGRPGSQGNYTSSYAKPMELPSHQNNAPGHNSFIAELPGNFYHPQENKSLHPPPQPSPGLSDQQQPPQYDRNSISQQSQLSPDLNNWRWSQGQRSPSQQSSRPTSMSSDGSGGGFSSPGLDHKGFSSELPTHAETQEEHRGDPIKTVDVSQHRVKGPQAYQAYHYNPQDYAQAGR